MPKKLLLVRCPCGQPFEVTQNRLDAGRGRYCSRRCMYAYRTRPSGLTYVKHKDNPTAIKPGQRLSRTTEFKPGQRAWNKGVSHHYSPDTEWKMSVMQTYAGLHAELKRARGPASAKRCDHADGTCKGRMQWANISHLYEGIADFMPLCQSHHSRYDRASDFWGGSTGWRRKR